MSRKENIRLGVIGCGKGAQEKHLPALKDMANVRVIAAADLNPDRLHDVVNRFGIEQKYTDYRRMLDRSDVDTVAVLTPTISHAEIGVAAISSGKHVFIDKPLALTLRECDELIGRAACSKIRGMVGFNHRWHRLIQRAEKFIQSGALGEIKTIRSVYTHWHPGAQSQDWHRKRKFGGGVVFNDAVHHFDLWRFLLKTEVVEVFSKGRNSEHFEDETNVITARLANGVLASGIFMFETNSNNELEIYGDLGKLYISCYHFDGLKFYPNSSYPGDISERLRKMAETIREIPQGIESLRWGGDSNMAFRSQWKHFIDCLLDDKPPSCTFSDGKCAVKIALGTIESVLSGKPIKISSL